MKYYLVKQWCPARDETSENPGCYFCGSYIYEPPLTSVRKDFVYKSKARAENMAARHWTPNYPTGVEEVPENIVE